MELAILKNSFHGCKQLLATCKRVARNCPTVPGQLIRRKGAMAPRRTPTQRVLRGSIALDEDLLRSNIKELFTDTEGVLPIESGQSSDSSLSTISGKPSKVFFRLDQIPPWYLSIMLGLKYALITPVTSTVVYAILSRHMCAELQDAPILETFQTAILWSGIVTVFQVAVGIRLPCTVGASVFSLAATSSLMVIEPDDCYNVVEYKDTTDPKCRYTEQRGRLAGLRGALVIAGVTEVFLGLSGMAALLCRNMSPITIATATLAAGLSLRGDAIQFSQENWIISMATIGLVTIFCQYMRNITVPIIGVERKGISIGQVYVFQSIGVLLSIILAWALSYAMGYSSNEAVWDVLEKTPTFRPPMMEMWLLPEVEIRQVVMMFPAVLVGMVNAMVAYKACSEAVDVPFPPHHAFNRATLVQGLGTTFGALMGTGASMMPMADSVAGVANTKVASRFIFYIAGFILIMFSFFPKISTFLLAVPGPILGGIMCITFGYITCQGFALATDVNLASPRNIFVLGMSTFLGVGELLGIRGALFAEVIPDWVMSTIKNNAAAGKLNYIDFSGDEHADRFLTAFLSNCMLLAGFLGLILDLLIPGNKEDRGKTFWKEQFADDLNFDQRDPDKVAMVQHRLPYDIPFITKFMYYWPFCAYMSVCPAYQPIGMHKMMSLNHWSKTLCGIDIKDKRKKMRGLSEEEETLRSMRPSRLSLSQVIMEDTMKI